MLNCDFKLHSCLMFILDRALPTQTAIEIDCWHHLRNVWFGGMSKALTKHMKFELKMIQVTLIEGFGCMLM